MAHLVKQKKTYHVGPDGKRCPKDAPGAKKVTEESSKWYACDIPGMGAKRVPLAKDKRVSLKLLNDLIERAERGEHGLPEKGKGQQPLAPLVTEFEAAVGRKAGEKHTRDVVRDVRRVLDGCGLVSLADLQAAGTSAKVEAFVHGLTDGEYGTSAVNAAVIGKHARQFSRWLWRKRKMFDHDPLAGVDLPSQETVNKRRAITPAELATLIDAADASVRTLRHLTGPARAVLYLTAAATGFRAGELAALEPPHFHLDADPPFVALPGSLTKNGKDAVQPLPPGVVARLRPLVESATGPVWPGLWYERAAKMLRADLAAAGIPAETTDGEAVFHSLRHSYGTMLGRVTSMKTQMELNRHSTPTLTARYSHTDMGEKAAAVERMPLPGSGNVSPFAPLTRPQLEQYAEAVTAVLAGLAGVLVTPLVTPAVDSTGDGLRRAETKRPENTPRLKRARG